MKMQISKSHFINFPIEFFIAFFCNVKILFIHSFFALSFAVMELLQAFSVSDSKSELSMSTAVSLLSSDSVSSISTTASSTDSTSLKSLSVQKSATCICDPSTCKYQSFSIPEKIIYYMAKNVTNPETYQKLIETCKYFFKFNPVVVVPYLFCKDDIWHACYYDVDGEHLCEINGLKNVKIWIQQKLHISYSDVSQIIPWIYKNDATVIDLRANYNQALTLEEFSFIAGNAENVSMKNRTIKYKNGEIVPFEEIVKNLPKLKYLFYESICAETIFTKSTAGKLMKIEHFKNITYLELFWLPETFNVETMLNYILENNHIQVYLHYSSTISNRYKELIQKYSDLLEKEDGCVSEINAYRPYYELLENSHSSSSSDDESFDDDENEDLLFPWNNEEEEEWELPWDKIL